MNSLTTKQTFAKNYLDCDTMITTPAEMFDEGAALESIDQLADSQFTQEPLKKS